jgi:peptidoglycan/LPS O-acetylase OafA/YrhL
MSRMGPLASEAAQSDDRQRPILDWVDGRGRGRVAALDGVRGVAILLVLLKHGLPEDVVPGGGIVGVDLFFVLSGFVITGTLYRRATTDSGIRLHSFYFRRAIRLLPALYVMLGLYVMGSVILGQNVGAAIGAAIASVFYYYNFAAAAGVELGNGPLWTLATEEQFYFVWPAIVVLGFTLSRRHPGATLLWVAWGLTVATWAFRAWSWHIIGVSIYTLPSTWSDSLLLGATLALTQACIPAAWSAIGRNLGRGSVQAALWAVVLGSAFIPNMKNEGWVYVWWLAPLGLAMAGIIWGLAERPPRVARTVLESSPALLLGAISYSTYLYNFLVFQALHDRSSNPVIVFGIGVVVSIALGTLSRRFIELPPLRANKNNGRLKRPNQQLTS